MVGPVVAVGALIRNKKGEILLVQSPKWLEKRYSVPGGHVELNERLSDAVVREAKEETGLDVRPIKLLLIQEVINPEEFYERERHFIFFDFLCEAMSEDVKLDNVELIDYVWVEPKKALDLKLESYTRRLVMKYLKYLEGDRETEIV
ncbi:MAG TPA: NUDIX domain-containing protein [Geobacterales bacterium]|nr:NUDIX domain-containing protein [Geobacterales bacterium]